MEISPQIEHLTVRAAHQEISPQLAGEWLAKRPFLRQRTLRANHVLALAAMMTRGYLRPSTTIDFASLDGQYLLVNGQHTLTAIVRCGLTQKLLVTYTFCRTMADVKALYATHDRGLLRTTRDSYAAFDLAREMGIAQQHVDELGAAMVPLAGGFTELLSTSNYAQAVFHRDFSIRQALMWQWKDEACLFFNNRPSGRKSVTKLLGRAAVVAVGLVTYRYQPQLAEPFWHGVLLEEGAGNDPIRRLFVFLQDAPVQRYPRDEYPRYIAAAWNAYMQQKNLVNWHVKKRVGSRPFITILGTPYTGNKTLYYMDRSGIVLDNPIVARAPEKESSSTQSVE